MALKYQGHVFDVMPACTCCDAQTVLSDPTGTRPIRTKFKTATRIKWQQLRSLVREMIVTSDLLQLRHGGLLSIANPAIVGGASKVQTFQSWFDLALGKVVLEGNGAYMKPFIVQAYSAGQAWGQSVVGAQYVSVNAMAREDLITALAVVELQGIMEAVSQQAVRAVANGLLNSKSPMNIVRDIWTVIDKIGQTRTKTMIELLVVKAFGDATLDVYAAVGITEVGLIPEGKATAAITDARKKRASNIGRRAKLKAEREAAKAEAEAREEAEATLKAARRAQRVAAGKKSAAIARRKRGGAGSRSTGNTPSGSTIARIESAEAKLTRLGSVYVRTAGDDDVCPVCEKIEAGGPYKIDVARSLIPAHPHCRCVFIPANDKRFKRRLKSDTRDMNTNHDPDSGQFTSGTAGEGGRTAFVYKIAKEKRPVHELQSEHTLSAGETSLLKRIRAKRKAAVGDGEGLATFGTPGTSFAEAITTPNPTPPKFARMPKRTRKRKGKKKGRNK